MQPVPPFFRPDNSILTTPQVKPVTHRRNSAPVITTGAGQSSYSGGKGALGPTASHGKIESLMTLSKMHIDLTPRHPAPAAAPVESNLIASDARLETAPPGGISLTELGKSKPGFDGQRGSLLGIASLSDAPHPPHQGRVHLRPEIPVQDLAVEGCRQLLEVTEEAPDRPLALEERDEPLKLHVATRVTERGGGIRQVVLPTPALGPDVVLGGVIPAPALSARLTH